VTRIQILYGKCCQKNDQVNSLTVTGTIETFRGRLSKPTRSGQRGVSGHHWKTWYQVGVKFMYKKHAREAKKILTQI